MKTSPRINNVEPRIALFQGSFDPFTVGHEAVVLRALPLFDTIVVAVVNNVSKTSLLSPDERLNYIKRVFDGNERVKVTMSQGLTVDVAKEVGASCLLRGVRSVKDFEYEMNMAQVNRDLSGIETMLLFTLPEHSHVSSSLVRELMTFGRDVSAYLPVPL